MLFGISLINMNVVLAYLGGFLLISSIGYLAYTKQQGNESLLQNIAKILHADTSEIILEDIREVSLFSKYKNDNLRKVSFGNKTYLVEVKDHKLIKMVEHHF